MISFKMINLMFICHMRLNAHMQEKAIGEKKLPIEICLYNVGNSDDGDKI